MRPRPDELGRATVGMSATIRDLVLPGGELVAAPATRATALVLRIDAVRPHGDAFRYDLTWYGLEPGTYRLADFLVRKDGAPLGELPGHTVSVGSLLPPGQVEPHRPEAGQLPDLGGYQATLILGALVWCLGFVWLLVRFRRRPEPEAGPGARRVSLAERLRPLVAAARAGELSPAGCAELELALLAFWRRRLGLAEGDAAAALRTLRAHPEAGPLLAGLEDWLHRPDPAPVDLERLLAPYAELPADALELSPALAEAAR